MAEALPDGPRIEVTRERHARMLAELASVFDKVTETLHRCPRLPGDGPDAQLVSGLTRREWEIAQFALKWVGALITIEGEPDR
jgi:hypothetical protein